MSVRKTSDGRIYETDLTILGTLCARQKEIVAETTTARTITHNDFGKTIICSNASPVTITLPAASAVAGAWFRLISTTAATVTCATTTTITGYANATASNVSVTDIGAQIEFFSDGTNWIAMSMSLLPAMTTA